MAEENQVSNSDLNDWQIEEIKKALAEADRGDFASNGEVQRSIESWLHRMR
jgi:RHH-type transcriptional regulator, rel operon repressor / antitoxin RelB